MTRNARYLPGGMTSTNRRIDRPLVFVSASGAEVTDADGRAYIDYNCAFGATLLGHCDARVTEAVYRTMQQIDLIGLSSTDLEGILAERLVQLLPSAEQVMFVNSGSEATYHALRLARATTSRPLIVKFQGGYHGWYDYVAMNVIGPAETIGRRHFLSAGTLEAAAEKTIVARFNDLEAFSDLVNKRGAEIAAVILEPIQHNIGAAIGKQEFLEGLRSLTSAHGIVLIFDEVITGFRHGLGGYQSLCGVTPDLTTLGKAMANGFPIAAIAGRRDLIQRCAPPPAGDVFLAGTYNGLPAAVAGALATIDVLEEPGTYDHLYRLGEIMRTELQHIFDRLGIPGQVGGYGSVWLPYFFEGPIDRFEDMLKNDDELDRAFRVGMIDRGCLTTPTPLKRYNLSLAHTEAHVARTLQAAEDVLTAIATKPSARVVA